MLCCGGCFFGEVASGFFLPASCCFARARGAPASRSPAAWMPVDVMLAPAEDQFWTDMHEGQMKLKIRVRRMKESRDMRGLSAGRLLSFRWGRRGKRGDTQPVPASPGGWRAADGDERDGCPYKESRRPASRDMEAIGERLEGARARTSSHGRWAGAIWEAAGGEQDAGAASGHCAVLLRGHRGRLCHVAPSWQGSPRVPHPHPQRREPTRGERAGTRMGEGREVCEEQLNKTALRRCSCPAEPFRFTSAIAACPAAEGLRSDTGLEAFCSARVKGERRKEILSGAA